jgi:hypothetical protein
MVSNDDRLAAARTSYTEYVEKRLEPFLESNKNLTWCRAVKWGLRNDMDFCINAGNIESTEIQEEYVELCIELLEANIANEREDATLMELPSKSDKPQSIVYALVGAAAGYYSGGPVWAFLAAAAGYLYGRHSDSLTYKEKLPNVEEHNRFAHETRERIDGYENEIIELKKLLYPNLPDEALPRRHY